MKKQLFWPKNIKQGFTHILDVSLTTTTSGHPAHEAMLSGESWQ
jgi:hypothetical protein